MWARLSGATISKMITLTVLGCRITVECEEAETWRLLTTNYGRMQGGHGPANMQYALGKPRESTRFFIIRAGLPYDRIRS
jgi:hypothetical protein